MEEKKDWILNNIHLKEGGIEDLLLEFSHAVIEDYQEKIEDDETLTRIPIAKKIDEEVYNLVQQELDKAREEGKREKLQELYEWSCIPVEGKFIDIESDSRFQEKILGELERLTNQKKEDENSKD